MSRIAFAAPAGAVVCGPVMSGGARIAAITRKISIRCATVVVPVTAGTIAITILSGVDGMQLRTTGKQSTEPAGKAAIAVAMSQCSALLLFQRASTPSHPLQVELSIHGAIESKRAPFPIETVFEKSRHPGNTWPLKFHSANATSTSRPRSEAKLLFSILQPCRMNQQVAAIRLRDITTPSDFCLRVVSL